MPVKAARVRTRRVNQKKIRKNFALMKMHGVDDLVLDKIRKGIFDRFAYDPNYLNATGTEQEKMRNDATAKEIKKRIREKFKDKPEEMPKSKILSLPGERLAKNIREMNGAELKKLHLLSLNYAIIVQRKLAKAQEHIGEAGLDRNDYYIKKSELHKLEEKFEDVKYKHNIIMEELKRRHYII